MVYNTVVYLGEKNKTKSGDGQDIMAGVMTEFMTELSLDIAEFLLQDIQTGEEDCLRFQASYGLQVKEELVWFAIQVKCSFR